MNNRAETTRIEEGFHSSRQSLHFKGIYRTSVYRQKDYAHDVYKLKLHVKVDSYDFQSYARIWVWNKEGLKWNLVHSIPYPEMETVKKEVFYGRTPASMTEEEKKAFKHDNQCLIMMAETILS